MTPTEIDNLPAGDELDRLVAEAIGHVSVREWAFPYRHPYFRPSTDWNDAMLAAEKFGTFSVHHLTKEGDDWVVGEIDWMMGDFERISTDKSGPLAIARAIAKLGVSGKPNSA